MKSLVGICFSFLLTTQLNAADHVISQKGKQFNPPEITIKAGESVSFKNDDDTSHNVFSSGDNSKFNLGIQKPGSETKQTFAAAGETVIRCAIHPKMKLKVIVK